MAVPTRGAAIISVLRTATQDGADPGSPSRSIWIVAGARGRDLAADHNEASPCQEVLPGVVHLGVDAAQAVEELGGLLAAGHGNGTGRLDRPGHERPGLR